MSASTVGGIVSNGNGKAINGHPQFVQPPSDGLPYVRLGLHESDGAQPRQGLTGYSWERIRGQTWLWAAHVMGLVVLSLMLFSPDVLAALPPHSSRLPLPFAISVLCAVGILPGVLAHVAYCLMDKRAAQRPVRPVFLAGQLPQELMEVAASAWRYECQRRELSHSRAHSFAKLWGLLATGFLIGAVTFLIPPIHPYATPFVLGRHLLALTVMAAVTARFLLDLGRICVRNANDDLSRRVFADAVNTLLLTLIATLAFALVIGAQPNGDPWKSTLAALGLGIAVAMVGMPAFSYAAQRASSLLGIKSVEQPTALPLTAIQGIHAHEIERLREEGIDSVECLVSTPLPRIFLNTRFSLMRICDWFNRGLLLCRLGASATAELRERAGIIGARDLLRLPPEQLAADAPLVVLLQKSLRLEASAQAQQLLRTLMADELAQLTEVYSKTLVELGAPAAEDHKRPAAAAS